MTGFMLDTDISSYIIKRRPATLVEKFEKHGDMLNVSVIRLRSCVLVQRRRPGRNSPS
jgi:hypothetical protein